jgi:ribosomal protein S18 acetylase RimI-like enzyme
MSELRLRQVEARDLDRCYEIERTAYEGDEAATREKIATRIRQYPQGFVVLERDGEVIGFINSGCADEVVMADEAFKELVGHNPSAPNVVIMSVVIATERQGQGYSTILMRHFVEQAEKAGKRSIHLMCRERHIALYRKFGYRYVQPSPSGHGGMAWHEMVMELAG